MNVLKRPTYTTTVQVPYSLWLTENDDDLRDWYRITSEWSPEQHPGDFDEFCRVQFDIACEEDERLRDGLYEVELAEADAEDEPDSGQQWADEDANLYRPGRDAA